MLRAACEQAEAAITFTTEHEFALRLAQGSVLHGWAQTMMGNVEEGLTEIRQGLAADLATGAKAYQPYFLVLLAEACGSAKRFEEGLHALAKTLATELGDLTHTLQ